MQQEAVNSAGESKESEEICERFWNILTNANLVNLRRVRLDLSTWRRGSAQMVFKVSPALNNVSIYSVVVTGVQPSEDLFRHLLSYNALQRRESLGLVERDNKLYVVLKYTMELELAEASAVERHLYALQEIADKLDTELAETFGGDLHFDDWNKMDQTGVDSLLDNLFG